MSNEQASAVKTLLITGADGFIGRRMMAAVRARGWRAIGLDRAPPSGAKAECGRLNAEYGRQSPVIAPSAPAGAKAEGSVQNEEGGVAAFARTSEGPAAEPLRVPATTDRPCSSTAFCVLHSAFSLLPSLSVVGRPALKGRATSSISVVDRPHP